MGQATINSALTTLRGRVGDLIFKRYGDKVVELFPVASLPTPGELQQRQCGSANVPSVGLHAFKQPEPHKSGKDVDAAIGSVGAARVFCVNERQEIGKEA